MHYFVKDKENLLSFELWSGGEYGTIIPLAGNNVTISKSPDWSTNGNNSLKVTGSTSTGSQYVGCTLDEGFPVNTSLKLSCDINTPVALTLRIFQKINGAWGNTSSGNIPIGENLNVNLIKAISETTQSLWIRVDGSNIPVDTNFYIDNFKLEVSSS